MLHTVGCGSGGGIREGVLQREVRPARGGPVTVAEVVQPLLRATLGDEVPVRLRCWDGSEIGRLDAPVRLNIRNRRALRRLLWAPNELGFARAYVSGDIEIEGDLWSGLEALEQVASPETGPGVTVDTATKIALAKAIARLGVIGPPPKPPAEEARLAGGRHSRNRDADAIAHHYDVGNDFYRLVLGDSMAYSCAYWTAEDRLDATGLGAAQAGKCDLVARKLGLGPGRRVLDVGCGWGTFAVHAATRYGARVVGVTLSQEQADYARERVVREGVQDLVEIRLQDYRDVDDGPFDAIASVGMAEHVGTAQLSGYAAALLDLLAPGGRLLNHAIARRPGPAPSFSKTSFIDRYVFPDGELQPVATMIDALERAGFEVRDVQSLREHYTLTLRCWLANLESAWDEAVAASSPARARIWRLYIAGSALAFHANRIGVNQVLAVKTGADGSSGLPLARTV
jgi:cyclopropane-fatty-acyl-phospholipid synthase